MNRKHKILISASITLNIVLITIVIMSVLRINLMTERTIKVNAIDKLFTLHDIISKQENENWSDLVFFSKQLEDTSNSIMHALNIAETGNKINKEDNEMLLKLGIYINRYSLIAHSNLSAQTLDEMKLDLKRFNKILAENDFDNEAAFDSWTKQYYLKKLRNIVSEIEKVEGDIFSE